MVYVEEGALMGAEVLIIIGISPWLMTEGPRLRILAELRISNIIPISHLIVAVLLISALALSLYISEEEHLWGQASFAEIMTSGAILAINGPHHTDRTSFSQNKPGAMAID